MPPVTPTTPRGGLGMLPARFCCYPLLTRVAGIDVLKAVPYDFPKSSVLWFDIASSYTSVQTLIFMLTNALSDGVSRKGCEWCANK